MNSGLFNKYFISYGTISCSRQQFRRPLEAVTEAVAEGSITRQPSIPRQASLGSTPTSHEQSTSRPITSPMKTTPTTVTSQAEMTSSAPTRRHTTSNTPTLSNAAVGTEEAATDSFTNGRLIHTMYQVREPKGERQTNN